MWLLLERTAFGKNLFAIGTNRVTARLSGVNVTRMVLGTYALAGLLAGLGGFLVVGNTGVVHIRIGDPFLFPVDCGGRGGRHAALGRQGQLLGHDGGRAGVDAHHQSAHHDADAGISTTHGAGRYAADHDLDLRASKGIQTVELIPSPKDRVMNIDRDELVRLTEEYGGAWGINHTRRLLRLISIIGEGQAYNTDALWVAAHLHDWGGYGKWAQPGVDHALRSRQVAETFLAERNYPPDEAKLILDCIEFHHADNSARCLEVQLLSDADALDFLGVVGVLRDVSKNAKDLRQAYDISRKRRAKLPGMLCLAKSKEIAVQRLADMDDLFAKFEADSFGCF